MAVLPITCVFIAIAASAAGERVRRFPAAAVAVAGAGSGASSFASAGPAGAFTGFGGPGFYFPQPPYGPDFNQMYQQWQEQMQAQQAFNQQLLAHQFGGIGGDGAAAVVDFGSDGGYGEASVGPDNGLGLRIAEEFSAPVGSPNTQSFGTFSSSSMHTSVDANGKRTTQKEAAIGVNDNGKIYFKKISDPPKS